MRMHEFKHIILENEIRHVEGAWPFDVCALHSSV
jgi:hypothetical protein